MHPCNAPIMSFCEILEIIHFYLVQMTIVPPTELKSMNITWVAILPETGIYIYL